MIKYFLILILLTTHFFAQTSFNVESFEIKEEFTESDPIDESLGKFQNFEIHLNKGDKVSIDISTQNFVPLLILISPKNHKYVESSQNGKTISFQENIDETGNWSLFIVTGKDDLGKYNCKISFSDEKSLTFPEKLTLQQFIDYFVAHSQADFVFLSEKLIHQGKAFSLISENSSFEKVEFIGKSIVFKLSISDKKSVFEELSKLLSEQFPDWRFTKGKKIKKEDDFVTSIALIENEKQNPRFVTIKLIEGKSTNLQFEFGKK
jgi:hypothetical protein